MEGRNFYGAVDPSGNFTPRNISTSPDLMTYRSLDGNQFSIQQYELNQLSYSSPQNLAAYNGSICYYNPHSVFNSSDRDANFHDRHNTWEGNNGGSAYSPMNALIVDPPTYNYHASATNTPCVQQDPRSSALYELNQLSYSSPQNLAGYNGSICYYNPSSPFNSRADTVTAASFHDRHNTWEGNNGGSAYSPMNSLIVDPPAYNYHASATNTPCVQQDPRSSAPVSDPRYQQRTPSSSHFSANSLMPSSIQPQAATSPAYENTAVTLNHGSITDELLEDAMSVLKKHVPEETNVAQDRFQPATLPAQENAADTSSIEQANCSTISHSSHQPQQQQQQNQQEDVRGTSVRQTVATNACSPTNSPKKRRRRRKRSDTSRDENLDPETRALREKRRRINNERERARVKGLKEAYKLIEEINNRHGFRGKKSQTNIIYDVIEIVRRFENGEAGMPPVNPSRFPGTTM